MAISVQSLLWLFKFSVGHCKSMMLLRRNPIKLLCLPCVYLASYPGLLTPVFVTCSTNVGEDLVKLHDHVLWRTWTLGGCVEEWLIHRETASKWVCYRSQTQTIEQLSTRHQAVLGSERLYGRNVPLLHTFTQRPGMSLHMISLTRPSPTLVQQVTNAGMRRPGYEATVYPLYHSCLKFTRLSPPELRGNEFANQFHVMRVSEY